MPDAHRSWFSANMTLKECENKCMKNCSCMAYANLKTEGKGSGCVLWFDELINMRTSGEYGQEIYIRLAASDLGMKLSKKI
ncbi:hypothetical protein Tsubulata_050595 [Turnera subulata]|uniref:Apple domain-containing protein n=1 Tax=Turnera subulata TaxID=218843 RepID=A0A9Q0FSN7_9ROSI|nr:hypothetical protein Tsubulata_050595 [Turnera subulata]